MLEINKIHLGSNIDLIKQIGDNLIDLSIQSPPYSDFRKYSGNSWGFEDFKLLAKEIYRVTKPGGICVWVVGDKTKDGSETGDSFRQALYFKDECSFSLHDTMLYQKSGCRYPEINRYYPIFEFMFVFSKGKPKTTNLIKDRKNIYVGSKVARKSSIRTTDGDLIPNSAYNIAPDRKIQEYGVRYNIWKYSIGKGNHSTDEISFKHPATFPEELAKDHIISWSNEGDLVADFFSGSGTTAKMAKLFKRNFICTEIGEEYVNISNERLKCLN